MWWALALQPFCFTVEHQLGLKNVTDDFFSQSHKGLDSRTAEGTYGKEHAQQMKVNKSNRTAIPVVNLRGRECSWGWEADPLGPSRRGYAGEKCTQRNTMSGVILACQLQAPCPKLTWPGLGKPHHLAC